MHQIIGELFLRGINNKFWDNTFFVLSVRGDSLPALEAVHQGTGLFLIKLWMDKKELRTFLEMMKRRRVWREASRRRAQAH